MNGKTIQMIFSTNKRKNGAITFLKKMMPSPSMMNPLKTSRKRMIFFHFPWINHQKELRK